MLGVALNVTTIIVGTVIGLIFKKLIPDKLSDDVMKGLGLCVAYIGISGSLEGNNTLILIISIVIGLLIGSAIDLDGRINRLGKIIETVLNKGNTDNEISVLEGFVTSTLLFCVGAMTIVGSLQAGLMGNNEMLITKSIIDMVSSVVLASSLGIGVIFSIVPIFVIQGGIVILAQYVSPFLGDSVIAEMTCAGSVIIIGLALNMLGITKIKVANLLPSIFIPIILCSFM